MIKFSLKADYGDKVYLKIDQEQLPHELIGVHLVPGATVYIISNGYEEFEVYDFQCSFEPDDTIRLGLSNLED